MVSFDVKYNAEQTQSRSNSAASAAYLSAIQEAPWNKPVAAKSVASAPITLAQQTAIKKATAAALPAKKGLRTPMQQLLYATFQPCNKFNADLPDEIWESIYANAGSHTKIMPIALASILIEREFSYPTERLNNSSLKSPNKQLIACHAGDEISIGKPVWSFSASSNCHSYTTQTTKILKGHTSYITCLAWSPNGNFLASGSWDNTVRVWNIATGGCMHKLEGHTALIAEIAWSPDGEKIATASRGIERNLYIWNASNGACLQNLIVRCSQGVSSIAWDKGARYLTSLSDRQGAKIWDAGQGICLHTIKQQTDSSFETATWGDKNLVMKPYALYQDNQSCGIEFLKDPTYTKFVNGQLTQEQFMLLWMLDTCKRENNKVVQPTSLRVLAAKIKNPAISGHTLIKILAGFHPIIAQDIIDYYKINNGKSMIQGSKEMSEAHQSIFAIKLLLPQSAIETILAEYLMGPQ